MPSASGSSPRPTRSLPGSRSMHSDQAWVKYMVVIYISPVPPQSQLHVPNDLAFCCRNTMPSRAHPTELAPTVRGVHPVTGSSKSGLDGNGKSWRVCRALVFIPPSTKAPITPRPERAHLEPRHYTALDLPIRIPESDLEGKAIRTISLNGIRMYS